MENMYFAEKICEIYLFGACYDLDYSGSFDMKIENDKKKNYFLSR